MKSLNNLETKLEEPLYKCECCFEVGHLSFRCPYEHKPCFECGDKHGKDCPQIICLKCRRVNHRAKFCSFGKVAFCKLCRRPGHKFSTCLLRRKPLSSGEAKCLVCFSLGHANCAEVVLSKAFSKRKKQKNSKKWRENYTNLNPNF